MSVQGLMQQFVLPPPPHEEFLTWGGNFHGQLGQGNLINSLTPIRLPGTDWKQIECGSEHVLALRKDGLLFGWGRNDFGQLGDGTTVPKMSPVQIGTIRWQKIACGFFHSLGINDFGQLFTWGSNFAGQLGTNDLTDRSTPTLIGVNRHRDIAGGSNHSLTIDHDNQLYACGRNTYGQLGDGTTTNRLTLTLVTGTFLQISAGDNFSIAINHIGDVMTFGLNAFGAIGDGTTINRLTPTLISLPVIKTRKVLSYANGNMALLHSGLVFTWGGNSNFEIGDGTTTNRLTPFQINTHRYNDISAGKNGATLSAIATNGDLWTWGNNANGEYGNGNVVTLAFPTVQTHTRKWLKMARGNNFAIAQV